MSPVPLNLMSSGITIKFKLLEYQLISAKQERVIRTFLKKSNITNFENRLTNKKHVPLSIDFIEKISVLN